jgi:hypothetical protein
MYYIKTIASRLTPGGVMQLIGTLIVFLNIYADMSNSVPSSATFISLKSVCIRVPSIPTKSKAPNELLLD